MRSALTSACRNQKLTHNVAKDVELPSGRKPRPLVWSDDRVALWRRTGRRPGPVMVWTPRQTGAFLDAVEHDRLYGLWHLAAFRGLRRGELCGLHWEDVDLVEQSLLVQWQLVEVGWNTEMTRPKSENSTRLVALDDETVAALDRHRERQEAERTAFGTAWQETGLVFTQADGAALHPAAGEQPVRRPRGGGGVAAGAASRPAPRRGDAGAQRGRRPEGRAGDARALVVPAHRGHLHVGAAGARPCGGRGRREPGSAHPSRTDAHTSGTRELHNGWERGVKVAYVQVKAGALGGAAAATPTAVAPIVAYLVGVHHTGRGVVVARLGSRRVVAGGRTWAVRRVSGLDDGEIRTAMICRATEMLRHSGLLAAGDETR